MRGITIKLNNVSVHTGNDLGLVQEAKNLGSPEVQSYLVEVPGRNGLLNLTKGLTGSVNYKNRTLSFQFCGSGARSDLIALVDTLNMYHGEKIEIIDDDTPGYSYKGEATVSSSFNPGYVTITLEVDAEPFREAITATTKTVTLTSTEKTVTINNNGMEVIPTITVTNSATVKKGDVTYTLTSGTYTLADYILNKSANTFSVKGSGSLTISYKEAHI